MSTTIPSLTPLENFRRMMQGQSPARLPFDVTVTPPVADLIERKRGSRDLVEALSCDFAAVYPPGNGTTADQWRDAYANAGIVLPERGEVDREGVVHVAPEHGLDSAYHFRSLHPTLGSVETVAELEQLPWGSLNNLDYRPQLADSIQQAHARGLPVVAWRECTIFEHSWYLRGMDQLMFDLTDEDPVGEWLLEWFTERSIADVRALCQVGVDVIGLGDDVGMQTGMMMSVPFWRAHFKPRLARVIQAAREVNGEGVLIRYHSDGDISAIIPDLIEIGVDILNPVQPECMDVAGTLRQYRDQLAFWGMIGTQSTLPYGSPDDVRRSIRELAELARGGIRMVAAPTHVLEPDVPWENIEALDEVFNIALHCQEGVL